MNDKVVSQAAAMAAQQAKIEDLTARVIRLETALEIVLSNRGTSGTRRLSRQLKE
jgi:hypothetical protein